MCQERQPPPPPGGGACLEKKGRSSGLGKSWVYRGQGERRRAGGGEETAGGLGGALWMTKTTKSQHQAGSPGQGMPTGDENKRAHDTKSVSGI